MCILVELSCGNLGKFFKINEFYELNSEFDVFKSVKLIKIWLFVVVS